MLCLLNLVILLFNDENIKNINNNNGINADTFYQLIYAIFVNDDKDNGNMKIIAILCVMNLLKINSCSLSKHIVEIYELLKTIVSNKPDLKKELKNLIIKAIEEIEKNPIYLNRKNINK